MNLAVNPDGAAFTAPVRLALSGPDRPLDIRHLIIEGSDEHPANANGVQLVARRLVREQLHAGDDARLVLLRPRSRKAEAEVADLPLTILPLTGWCLGSRTVTLAPCVLDTLLARATSNTFFHIHGGREPLLTWLTYELDKRGLAYGMTIHGRYSHIGLVPGRRRSILGLYLRMFERGVLERARFVHAVSSEERTVIRRIAPKAVIEVIPNAAFSSALDGVPRPPLRVGRSRDFPVFGFCGRYEIGHKGLDLLLQGFAAYQADGGPGRLALVGTGPGLSDLRAMASALGIGDRVDVLGPKFGHDKAAAHHRWDYFVQASRFDGLPIGALEAALMGLPLLVTPATGLQAAVRQYGAGVLIHNVGVEPVRRALERAARISPDEWSAMSMQSFAMARDMGDWTKISRCLRDLYQRALVLPSNLRI